MGDADTTSTPETDSKLTAEETTKKLKLTDSEEDSKPKTPDNNNSSEKPPEEDPPQEEKEELPTAPTFKVVVMYNKNPLQLQISESMTVLQLKQMVKEHVNVDVHLQKVLLKGIAKDEALLKDLGVTKNTKKILVIGSSIADVLKVKEVPNVDEKGGDKEGGSAAGGNWCSLPNHKKIIDKGLPDDVMPGILGEHDPLPPFPLSGMYSSKGSKVRLTFKLENDELWIGTKERTEKVPIGTIRNVTSQPITGYEHYHILAIQLGPTEASRIFLYWCPSNYVEAIKDALTGP